MPQSPPFVGRSAERATLSGALEAATRGAAEAVLIGGDAGVGKSRLISEVTRDWGGTVLHGAARSGGAAYGPIAEMLHAARVAAFADGRSTLAAEHAARATDILPDSNAALIAAPIADALRALARHDPVAVVLDDLHWADAATVDLLTPLVDALAGARVCVIGVYRTSELPRAHPLRRIRADLRRAGQLTEIALRPLDVPETASLLSGVLGAPPAAELVSAVHTRSDGVAFYVAELATALVEAGLVRPRDGVATIAAKEDLPFPNSVLDSVAVCTAGLRQRSPAAVDLASVLGVRVDLPVLAGLAGESGVDALLDAGLLEECGEDTAEFRHALVRDALYRSVPWARRRSLHRAVAKYLAGRDERPEVVAEHWIGAHETERARPLLLIAAQQRCAVHAYRDATMFARRAIALWPDDVDPADRIEALAGLADCEEMSGEPDAAGTVWADVAALRAEAGDVAGAATAQRRLANVAGLLGDWQRTVTAREAAAESYAEAGLRADAAVERLALAEHLEGASYPTQALEHAVAAAEDADASGRPDLKAHALALQGCLRVRLGEERAGVELARAGLELALTEQLGEAAGASYFELANALLHAADYTASVEAYDSATELCRAHGVSEVETACAACMSVAARLHGDWDHALAISSEVLEDDRAPETVRMIAEEEAGLIGVLRGNYRRAHGPLRRAAVFGRDANVFGIEIGALWGLAMHDAANDTPPDARRVSSLLRLCEQKETSTFALPPLRWASTFLAERGHGDPLALCHRVLAVFATQNSSPKVLSALAHAGGELAMVNGDATQASAQFGRALELLPATTAPLESALTRLRHGAALARQAERDSAVESITSSYHVARRLGAKPLAHSCAVALESMGERVDRRLGRLAARALEPAGLTRREKEVLRLVATGRTNRRIADELFLSTRTVDMHMRNLLTKLDCSSRVAAVRRATELGLVPGGLGVRR